MQRESRFSEGHKEQCLEEITIGGLVHVIRSKPTGEFGGKVNITAAEDQQKDIKVMINFPSMLNDTLATKFTAMKLDGGGYFNNPTRGGNEGDIDVEAYSFSALWESHRKP